MGEINGNYSLIPLSGNKFDCGLLPSRGLGCTGCSDCMYPSSLRRQNAVMLS